MPIAVEMIFSGIVSKFVNDYGDKLKKKIKDTDKNRKSGAQDIEIRIYQVMIDALNEFTHGVYKGQDVLYDAAENILKGFKRNKNDNVEAVKTGLKILVSQVTGDICKEFLRILCYEICKDEKDILYKEIMMFQHGKIIEDMHEGFQESHQNEEKVFEILGDVKKDTEYIRNNLGSKEVYDEEQYGKSYIENRAEEYAQKWNKNVFLNNYDEEDERAGDRVNIKLKDIYLEKLLPSYILNMNQGLSDNLKGRLERYIVDKSDREMLLILGQPGIGKSTLITWIMANLVEKKDEIFVYQFAPDLKKVNWQGENTLEEIFKVLRIKDEELKNKVLILDGFDEISISSDRERILNKLYKELKRRNRLGKFSLIITCRENYVNKSWLVGLTYITLQAWNENQIKIFCEIYEKESSGNLASKFHEAKINGILKNKEVFGIPLILYMIMALDITIEENSSIGDVYDHIFSLERGEIYNRCYDAEHRINEPKIKRCIHQVSQRISFWIFENNADAAFIYQKNFKEICDTVLLEAKEKNENIQSDTLIGSYFIVKHCEGELADEVNFVHRSIYEYFVAVYFFESISNLTSEDKVAGKLGELLKKGRLSTQILKFVKYKFDKMKGFNLPNITKEIFNEMLRHGMIYHTKVEEPYNDVIERERNIFSNMLDVVNLWNTSLGNLDKRIILYLQCNREGQLDLRGIHLNVENVYMRRVYLKGASTVEVDLSRVYLSGANLSGANLSGANLSRTNLSRADLVGTDLIGADLSGADLNEANLSRADLSGADLSGADLIRADLSGADLSGADLSGTDLSGAVLSRALLIETNLIEADLSGANLSRAGLVGANLSGANLIEADLSEASLSGADLRKANLEEAILAKADLKNIKLEEAILEETIFDETQVELLYEKYDLSNSMIVLYETEELLSYEEYCARKQQMQDSITLD